MFGAGKKNVFNPFQKKAGNAPKPAEPKQVEQHTDTFGFNSQPKLASNSNSIHQEKSKISSGGQSSNFDSKIVPVSLDDSNHKKPSNLNTFEEPKNDSGENSGIAEQISEYYDDDEFEIDSIPKEQLKNAAPTEPEDFFNQNKNFTGHLGGLADKKQPSEKLNESEEDSGFNFDENYEQFF